MTDAVSGTAHRVDTISSGRTVEQLLVAARLSPGDAGLWSELGSAYLIVNHPQDAVAAFRRALALRPDFPAAYFGLGNALFGLGKLAEAVNAFTRAVSLAPGVFSAHLNLGIALSQAGAHDEAVAALQRATALDPNSFDGHFVLGAAFTAAKRYPDAVSSYRDALEINPDSAETHLNLGVVLERRQEMDEAVLRYRRAAALRPTLVDAHANLGAVLSVQGQFDAAIAAYREAVRIDPNGAQLWRGLAVALKKAGRLDDAIMCYRRAAALDSDSVVIRSDLGMTLCEVGRYDEAIEACRQALKIDPRAAPVWVNLGIVYGRQYRVDEAIDCYRHAIALDPSLVEAHIGVGLSLCLQDQLNEGFSALRSAAKLKYGVLVPDNSTVRILPHKEKHDREQLDYLVETASMAGGGANLVVASAGDVFAGVFHVEGGGRLAGPAINPANDTSEIETKWEQSTPKIVVVDNLLTPEAMDELRRFCWGSTIWRRANEGGYVGAFLTTGFASPLLAQIADELRAKFPRIIRRHPLMDSWAFKYDSRLKGTGIHADFAAVNVNFWITPDEASLDPEGGGLIVWDTPAPLDWDFKKYNDNNGGIRDFLARAGAKSITVPYRANRAIVFDSDLFHETDRITFKEGYRNRRINITLLYGLRHDLDD